MIGRRVVHIFFDSAEIPTITKMVQRFKEGETLQAVFHNDDVNHDEEAWHQVQETLSESTSHRSDTHCAVAAGTCAK